MLTSNLNEAQLFLAGIWHTTQGNAFIVPHYTQGKLGQDDVESMVWSGWAFQSGQFGGDIPVYPIDFKVLQVNSDGHMELQNEFVNGGNYQTNGTGALHIADFNKDGINDVFLGSHNESPFSDENSVALISSPEGYDRLEIQDSVHNHDTSLNVINGELVAVGSNFGKGTPVYTWNSDSGSFEIQKQYEANGLSVVNGMSSTVADFNNDGKYEIIISDGSYGPGLQFDPNNLDSVNMFEFNTETLQIGEFIKSLPTPYFDATNEYSSLVSFGGAKKTHHHRIDAVDINNDGLLDVLASGIVWDQSVGHQAGIVQVYFNKGNLEFVDRTNELMGIDPFIFNSDHSPIFADFDGSGSMSIFAGDPAFDSGIKSGIMLLNDGTGGFHTTDVDRFDNWETTIHSYLEEYFTELGAQQNRGYFLDKLYTHFRPYTNNEGNINYVSINRVGYLEGDLSINFEVAVSIEANENFNVDFTKDVKVTLDEQSVTAHAWAGNDTFVNAAGNQSINGGLGIDTSKYSGNLSDYSVTKSGSNYLVVDNRSGSPDGTDTLVNVEKLQFADQTVDIDAGVTFTSSVETLFSSYEDAAKGLSAAYGVLLDGVPNQAGFKFLIGNAAVTNFGAGDGPVFNQENIFINLVNNLVQGNPAAKTKFNTLATGDTLEAKIAALYNAVIPASNQTTDGLNFFTRPEGIKFFEDAAAERGIAGAEGAAVAALAAMLKIVVTEDIGIGNSVNDLIKAIAAGSSGVPETSSALIPLETADGTAFDGDEASTSRLAFEAPVADDEVPLIQTIGITDDPFAMV